jgi:hypothetical protein
MQQVTRGIPPGSQAAVERISQESRVPVKPTLRFHEAEEQQSRDLRQRPRVPIVHGYRRWQLCDAVVQQATECPKRPPASRVQVEGLDERDGAFDGESAPSRHMLHPTSEDDGVVHARQYHDLDRGDRDGRPPAGMGSIATEQDTQLPGARQPPGGGDNRARLISTHPHRQSGQRPDFIEHHTVDLGRPQPVRLAAQLVNQSGRVSVKGEIAGRW